MMFKGRWTVLDNRIWACDYDFVMEAVHTAVQKKRALLVSPVASQTLALAHTNPILKKDLDSFDMLVPDGQWVRHALHFLYGIRLPDRVYGPELMKRLCAKNNRYRIYLYGNTSPTLSKLTTFLRNHYKTRVVGRMPSPFRSLSKKEKEELISDIITTRANIVFVSLGSPLQEQFSLTLSRLLLRKKYPTVIIPVGAAFDFMSGAKKQAPAWMGNIGLEWFFRLTQEPARLAKRYMWYGSYYLLLVARQKLLNPFDNKLIKGKA